MAERKQAGEGAQGAARPAPAAPSRRRFLGRMAGTACGAALAGLGVGLYARSAAPLAPHALRPPGALAEPDFLAACVRCGLCVRDCPFDTLRLAALGDPAATPGTPYFVAREIPCEMCEPIHCVEACPTGALDPALTDIDAACMGLAVVLDQETCLAFQGLRCEVCFNVCPVQGEAITLAQRHNPRTGQHAQFVPVVHSAACTGCGKCEHACITEEAAIKVLPLALARGDLGEHYRFGLDEKARAGGSLLAPDEQHRYHLPEGVDYRLDAGGLRPRGEPAAAPYGDDPLDTLNRGLEGGDG
ncbi:ferredoxin-type protein NapG [Billgrantia azerbaijanica]|nr:ferredoxin-type protein NapG [Halomonas azerbaijanica]